MRKQLSQAVEAVHATSNMIRDMESAGQVITELIQPESSEPLQKIDALIYAGLGVLLIAKAYRVFTSRPE